MRLFLLFCWSASAYERTNTNKLSRNEEELRATIRPIIKIVGVLLLIAIAASGLVVVYFLRLAGGLWGGN